MNSTVGWPERPDHLTLFRIATRSTVLGPGRRSVLWVQGCPFSCPGCVVPESLPFSGGVAYPVAELAGRIVADNDIDGVTFSGGEPMSQAAGLCELVDRIRAVRDLSFMSYTGFTLEQLRSRGTRSQRALLERLDILVDGPYVRARHTDLIWRGSDNQRVILLTERHRSLEEKLDERGTWIEFEVHAGGVAWMGIPRPGFRKDFEELMRAQGINLSPEGGGV
ncbi:MAG: hypothetical protein BGO49_07670 [Planctomycetales bacterium 71-10]|nr:MAG: hypothetical protein BGO49_07670 [Planctomycetales bacterium 71-10]